MDNGKRDPPLGAKPSVDLAPSYTESRQFQGWKLLPPELGGVGTWWRQVRPCVVGTGAELMGPSAECGSLQVLLPPSPGPWEPG